MRALSLTQPWASLIACGAKVIETRSWQTSYRGPLAIHASKGFPRECRDLCATQPFLRELTRAGLSMPELPLGAVVAVCRLTAVLDTSDAWSNRLSPTERAFGDYGPSRYGWVLEDVTRLPSPVPCRGALGLWSLPRDVAIRVLDAAEAA